MDKVKEIFRFYTTFQGRATRWDYNIKLMIVTLVGSLIAAGLDYLIFGKNAFSAESYKAFGSLWSYLMLWPTLALTARRLHDVNRSGWIQLWIIVPMLSAYVVMIFSVLAAEQEMIRTVEWLIILGYILAILGAGLMILMMGYLCCARGTVGENKYGSDPLEGVK